jgi:serine protease AprX
MNRTRRYLGVTRVVTTGAVALALTLAACSTGPSSISDEPASSLVSVIVRELPQAGDGPERLVRDLDGEVGRHIGIIDGFVATIPADAVDDVSAASGVWSVTPNARIQLHGLMDGYDADHDANSVRWVNKVMGAHHYWNDGYTGSGIDVALIDSGVAPVNGLTYAGKVVNGPDLSFESQAANLQYLDTYGHGTHMAGIIAGRDDGAPEAENADKTSTFMGIAPGARIVSVKVADSSGAVDVSQVVAAIDWVVQNRNTNGMNIRVLNLSFGTDGVQDYQLDPLTYAVEVAWRKGIVVVVAAGNAGYGTAKLNNPAYDPRVIAVGAAASNGTFNDDGYTVASFSSCGNGNRNPDLVAAGKSIASLRAPGSYADITYPSAQVGNTPRFVRGSGTSQAAAVVSGAAALVIQERPSITPDQLKKLLTMTSEPVPNSSTQCQGAGMMDLDDVHETATPSVASSTQTFPLATGLGSLNAARGSAQLTDGGIALAGEQDIFEGTAWNAPDWAAKTWSGTSWSAGVWNGKTWSGDAWNGSSWAAKTWSGKTWSGKTWSGKTWSSIVWSAKTWSWTGKTWSTGVWTNYGWSAGSWTGKTWSIGSWG